MLKNALVLQMTWFPREKQIASSENMHLKIFFHKVCQKRICLWR